MPRFFFHIRGAREGLSRDELGLDFPDLETAYHETFFAARDIGAMFAACGRHPHDYFIDVVDAADKTVFRLAFSDCLDHQVLRFAKTNPLRMLVDRNLSPRTQ